MIILKCSICGREIERTKETKNPVCFDCKQKRNRERARQNKQAKKKESKSKPFYEKHLVENPKENFVKYSKKLIISLHKDSAKTKEYKKWLYGELEKEDVPVRRCPICNYIMIRKSHILLFHNHTWFCTNKHCVFGSDHLETDGFPVWITDKQRGRLKKRDYFKAMRLGHLSWHNLQYFKVFQ